MLTSVGIQLVPVVVCIATIAINLGDRTKAAWFGGVLLLGALTHGSCLLWNASCGGVEKSPLLSTQNVAPEAAQFETDGSCENTDLNHTDLTSR